MEQKATTSTAKKFLLYQMFSPLIAKILCASNHVVTENGLVSADGYMLQDKNGLYLIPKERD